MIYLSIGVIGLVLINVCEGWGTLVGVALAAGAAIVFALTRLLRENLGNPVEEMTAVRDRLGGRSSGERVEIGERIERLLDHAAVILNALEIR